MRSFAERTRAEGTAAWETKIDREALDAKSADATARQRIKIELKRSVDEIEAKFQVSSLQALRDVEDRKAAIAHARREDSARLDFTTQEIAALFPTWAKLKGEAAETSRAGDERHSALLQRREVRLLFVMLFVLSNTEHCFNSICL